MAKVRLLLLSLLAGALPMTSADAAKPAACNPKDAAPETDGELAASDWNYLFHSYQKHGCADDGAMAEAYDEAIRVHMLKRWKELPMFWKTLPKNDGFSDFLLRHINEDWSPDELARLSKLARSSCTANMTSLCKKIEKAAAQAGQ